MMKPYSTNPKTLKSRAWQAQMPEEKRNAVKAKQRAQAAERRAQRTHEQKQYVKERSSVYYKGLQERLLQGLCAGSHHCKDPKVGESRYCLRHWVATLTRSPHGRKEREGGPYSIDVLMVIWEQQDGKCALSGVPLVPGLNASVDHVIPVSRGGGNTPDNLRFIHSSLNRFRGGRTDDEFKQLVRELCPALLNWANQ